MASTFLSASPSSMATLSCAPKARSTPFQQLGSLSTICGRLRLVPKIQITKASRRVSPVVPSYSKTTITCSGAQPETLKTVQDIIAKQLSIDESSVTPETKFADLGADSLDTVEIMMALEEKFGVSIGEGGAENISTVQDAADLIEKVKAAA